MNVFLDLDRDGNKISLPYEVRSNGRRNVDGFGYYYLLHLRESTENFGLRTYNVSRHMALRQIQKYCSFTEIPLSSD